jgi:hypothetical protein
MTTWLRSVDSKVQSMLYMDAVPAIAPELTLLWPRFETWARLDGDDIGIMCDHPKYPRANWFDYPKASIYVRYKFGRQHQQLLAMSRDPEWRLRRVRLLLRLLLRKLAREVAKANQAS